MPFREAPEPFETAAPSALLGGALELGLFGGLPGLGGGGTVQAGGLRLCWALARGEFVVWRCCVGASKLKGS